ncbi:hypothetical protein [Mycolicibacter kumamotonensis]|nr:hypothetical protein [Mycolicibacter kumamotonensis]
MARRIITAREQVELAAFWRSDLRVGSELPPEIDRDQDGHPDLDWMLRLFGCAHTACGRHLHHHRLAALPWAEQEARLADPRGWQIHNSFQPVQFAIQGARGYNSKVGLGDPHDMDYSTIARTPQSVRDVGRAYDALPEFDQAAAPHWDAMRREVGNQFDHAVNTMGIRPEFVDYDPYADVHEMVGDLNNNRRLKVLSTAATGGHPYFSNADNDKFRFVHDLFGHAATGRSFDRHGEEASFLTHSKMFSPQALPALASETRGQNSSLILNGEFGPQKVATLNPQFWRAARRRAAAPRTPSLDPDNDPMGRLNKADFNYNDMVNNLVSHYHGANDQQRTKGRFWYKAAHDLFNKMAENTGVSPQRAVAIGSAFSPQTDWDANVRNASNFLMNYNPHPDERHNWQMANVHPEALRRYAEQYGGSPRANKRDLGRLANMHDDLWQTKVGKGAKATSSPTLRDPERRAEWIANIQHHGIDKVMEDHARQVRGARNKKNANGGVYSPRFHMRDAGIPTLGGNINKAKQIFDAPEDVGQFNAILGGPKVQHFSNNILDDTPINEQGYYEHPNGDWTQHADLGGTIDSHHIRASSMPHGGWFRKGYLPDGGLNPSDPHTYDVFNRALLDATHRVNSGIANPAEHLTPKQLQAIIWLKHKDDNDYFDKHLGLKTQGDMPYIPADQQRPPRAPGLRNRQRAAGHQDIPPLWRKMFMSRNAPSWNDLLDAWVSFYAPHFDDPDDEDFEEDPHGM